jgi:hypothetical protein
MINFANSLQFHDCSLIGDQAAVFEKIRHTSTGIYILTRSPSCGKSFFIGFMKQYWDKQGKKILLTATTGVAAIRLDLSASTVYTAFKIPRSGQLNPLHRSSEAFDKIYSTDIIIIDECSMLILDILKHIVSRMHEVQQGQDRSIHPFCMKMLLLVGNLCQLPAVCKHIVMDFCLLCHLSASLFFSYIQIHNLTTILQQALDPIFLAFLNSLRI